MVEGRIRVLDKNADTKIGRLGRKQSSSETVKELRLDLRIYWLCRNGFRPGLNKTTANGVCFENSFLWPQ
jgi:hypothetical protein